MARCAAWWSIVWVVLSVGAHAASGDELPVCDPAVCELHGTLLGKPFWAKLLAPDGKFGGNRVLQLVYTPPAPEQVDGAHLSDCPFVLLDAHLRVVAWNGRDSASAAEPILKPLGYRISRDLLVGDGDNKHSEAVPRVLAGEVGWDLNLTPVLLALGWKEGTTCQVRAVDLFGPRWHEQMTVGWIQRSVAVAGATWTVIPDEQGRLRSVAASGGEVVLDVRGRP